MPKLIASFPRLPGGFVLIAMALAACSPASTGVPAPPGTPSGVRQIFSEADLSAAGAGLRDGQSAVLLVEHPAAAADADDSGGIGFSEVPLIVSAAGDLTLEFVPRETGHTLELRGQDQQVLGKLDAKSPRLRAAVPAGRHVLVLRHPGGGDPSMRVPFFVHYGRSSATPGRYALLAEPGGATVQVTQEGCAGCDLSGHRFDGALLDGMNFAGANLFAANFTKASLEGAILTGANLAKATLDDASLKLADLHGASLGGAIVTRARFDGADLRGVSFQGATLADCAFPGVNARSASFHAIDLPPGSKLDFSDADLTDANFRGLVSVGSSFARATLTRASFAGANLWQIDFTGVDATEADFSGATLANSEFSQAYFAGASLRRAILNSTFSGTVFDRASLQFATTAAASTPPGMVNTVWKKGEVKFTDVSAVEADFSGAQLQDVMFERGDFSRARLFQANLSNSRFYLTTLTGAILLISGEPPMYLGASLDGAILPPPPEQ